MMTNTDKKDNMIMVAVKHPGKDLEVSCYTKEWLRLSEFRSYVKGFPDACEMVPMSKDGLVMLTDEAALLRDLPLNLYVEVRHGVTPIQKICGTVIFTRLGRRIDGNDFLLNTMSDDDLKTVLHLVDEDYQKELNRKYREQLLHG